MTPVPGLVRGGTDSTRHGSAEAGVAMVGGAVDGRWKGGLAFHVLTLTGFDSGLGQRGIEPCFSSFRCGHGLNLSSCLAGLCRQGSRQIGIERRQTLYSPREKKVENNF